MDFDEEPGSSPATKAQLHICSDRIYLSTNLEYDFKLLGDWPIDSLSQALMEHGGVTLIMTSKEQEKKIIPLKTERAHDICSKLTEQCQCLAPAGHQQFQYSNTVADVQQCDGNSNILTASSVSKSCELLHQQHFELLTSKSRTFPSSRVKPSLSLRELTSLSCSHPHLQAKSPLSSDGSICKDKHGSMSSSSSTSTEQGSDSDNGLNVQKQLKLTTHNVHADGTKHEEEASTRENYIHGEHLPPPIPQRKLKPAIIEQVKTELHDDAKSLDSNSNGNELAIPRSRSFQIVEQPSTGTKRQRFKSEPSVVMETEITELVEPIWLDEPHHKSANHLDGYRHLQANRAADTEARKGVCPPKQDEWNNISCAMTQDAVDTFDFNSTAIQSGASTHTYCMPAPCNSDTQAVDEKSQFIDKVDSSDSTCHYVNLPEGSRPSCYLYMNLPDRKLAPEAVSCVSHVFMSRSMKGMYENVQQFYNEKFETAVSSEESTSPPPLPPPVLQPRLPPPRVPRRVSKDSKGVQKPPVALSFPKSIPCGQPPPRPPKKQASITKVNNENFNVHESSYL